MIQAALKDKDIEARGQGKEPATEEEILALLQKMIKQRQESAGSTTRAAAPSSPSRSATRSRSSPSYLPAADGRGRDQGRDRQAPIAETGAAGLKDMGKVMAALKGDTPARWISARRAAW